MRLKFAPDGKILTDPLDLLELQIPVLLDIPAWPLRQIPLARARAMAAQELKTLAVVYARNLPKLSPDLAPWIVPIFSSDDVRTDPSAVEAIRNIAQLLDSPDVPESADRIRAGKPQAILSVRMTLGPGSVDRILELSGRGLRVFHLCADQHGRERRENGTPGRHIKDVLREIHTRLVNEGVRDEITLIISGGIALAEHVAKAIICGADLVAVDTALLAALGCRVCRNSHPLNIDGAYGQPGLSSPDACPVQIDSVDSSYAAQRMKNLMGAWHSQLIEVLGAMGIREVRRLRGEMGRAIFMEEIEKEAFGDLLHVSQERAVL